MGFPHVAGKFQVCSCCLESKAHADCNLKILKREIKRVPCRSLEAQLHPEAPHLGLPTWSPSSLWVSASSRGWAALSALPQPCFCPAHTSCPWPLTFPALSSLCWQAMVTRCPLCVLGGGGAPVLLLAAESQLPAGLWGQRVAGDWPGGMEPKTLEVTLYNPYLALVGKLRLSEGKELLHAFLEQTSGQDTPFMVCRHADLSFSHHGVLLPSRIAWVCLCLCVSATHPPVCLRVDALEHSSMQGFSVCVCISVCVGFPRSPVPSCRDTQGLSSTAHSPCLLGASWAYPRPLQEDPAQRTPVRVGEHL